MLKQSEVLIGLFSLKFRASSDVHSCRGLPVRGRDLGHCKGHCPQKAGLLGAGLLLPIKHRQPDMGADTREGQNGYTHGASTSRFDVEAVASNTDYARDPEVRWGCARLRNAVAVKRMASHVAPAVYRGVPGWQRAAPACQALLHTVWSGPACRGRGHTRTAGAVRGTASPVAADAYNEVPGWQHAAPACRR